MVQHGHRKRDLFPVGVDSGYHMDLFRTVSVVEKEYLQCATRISRTNTAYGLCQ